MIIFTVLLLSEFIASLKLQQSAQHHLNSQIMAQNHASAPPMSVAFFLPLAI